MSAKIPSSDIARRAADLAADRKAADITTLLLANVSSVADYFVICSGRSHTQVAAICDRVSEGLREQFGISPLSTEGLDTARWAILDYGDVVVHVFQDEARKFYDLERLWEHAPRWNYEEGSGTQTARV